jgi:Flp pilus assembly protein TadG
MAVRRPRRFALFARFLRASRGATAVEFAFVALPFLVLLFGIIELGGVFLASTTLELATDKAARQIRTGEFTNGGGSTKDDFKTLVCQQMSWLQSSCPNNLFIDVRTFDNFQDLAATNDIGGANFDDSTTCWATGAPTDIVLVRTFYRWDLFTPMLDRALENVPGTNTRLISTVSTFRNEPYSDTPAAGAQC